MRDILFFSMTLILIVLALRSGLVAYLLWGWAGLISLQSYVYGFMQEVPYVQIFAIIALFHLILTKDLERLSFKLNATSTLFIIFVLHMTVCASMSTSNHPRNWDLTYNMMKTIFFCVLMPMQLTSRLRIHAMVLVIAISTAIHGLLDGLKFVASGGSYFATGIAKFGDNNNFAMVMLMIIPFVIYLIRQSNNKILRWSLFAVIPMILFSVLATQSRGALIGMGFVGVWYVLNSKNKTTSFISLAACVVLILAFAPPQWVERMNTINQAGQDTSMMGRVGAWQISSAVALKHPFIGAGPHAIEIGSVWQDNLNERGFFGDVSNLNLNGSEKGRGRAAHSIYFEVLGDMGFVGLFMFILIIINAFVSANEIYNLSKMDQDKYEWARSLAEMLSLSLLAYIVAGSLLSAAYFELPYMVFMILEVVRQQLRRELVSVK